MLRAETGSHRPHHLDTQAAIAGTGRTASPGRAVDVLLLHSQPQPPQHLPIRVISPSIRATHPSHRSFSHASELLVPPSEARVRVTRPSQGSLNPSRVRVIGPSIRCTRPSHASESFIPQSESRPSHRSLHPSHAFESLVPQSELRTSHWSPDPRHASESRVRVTGPQSESRPSH